MLNINICTLMKLFTKSLVFASQKHQYQRRKNDSNVPYINHPLEVAHILNISGVEDPIILAAGILHDTV
jgi:guanosine-3',5'-bis(diphosphate) 3'-pyrophosphohydrolase